MNKEVSFELAKLLKEKGYIEVHEQVYRSDGLLYTPNMSGSILRHSNILDDCSVTAPTIAEVVMWLYEKHGVWICLVPAEDNREAFFRGENITDQNLTKSFETPTEAFEAAIKDISLKMFSIPKDLQWTYLIVFTEDGTYSESPKSFNSQTEAYEAVIKYALNKYL